jgi:hypothetical protein
VGATFAPRTPKAQSPNIAKSCGPIGCCEPRHGHDIPAASKPDPRPHQNIKQKTEPAILFRLLCARVLR